MANNYGIFFTKGGTVIRLPVNPEELPESRENANSEYNVLGVGPIMVPRIPKLKTVSISSLLPGKPVGGWVLTKGGFEEPEFYIDFFESALQDGEPILYTPVRYYEDGTPYMSGETGFEVLVTSFEYKEKAGETGDFYIDLELTEYRDYSPQTVDVQLGSGRPTATSTKTRSKPAAQLCVGSTVIANGKYYYTSYGDEPHGNGNGRRCKVSRIITNDSSRPYPVHITTESGGWLGWIKASNLEVVG